MSRAYQRGTRWWVAWTDEHGKYRREPAGESITTKTAARKLAAELQLQADRRRLGLEDAAPQRMTFTELWERYDRTVVSQHRGAKQTRSRWTLHLAPAFGARLLHQVAPVEFEEFLVGTARPDGKPLSPQTRKHLRNQLRAMLNFAIHRLKALRGPNPFTDQVPIVRVPRRKPRHLSAEQVVKLLAATQDEVRALFAVAVYCGLRKGELCGLLVKDVDLEGGWIHVRHSYDAQPKDEEERSVPIPDELVPYLRVELGRVRSRWLFPAIDGSMRTRAWKVEKVFRTALKRAGLVEGYEHACRRKRCGFKERRADGARSQCPTCGMILWVKALPLRFTFKDLRSTYMTHFLRVADLVTVQRAAGHSDPKITEQHYIGADAERMRVAAKKLSFGGGGGQ